MYRYGVSGLNGFRFIVLSPLPWHDFLRVLRSDGYCVTEQVYMPLATIGHIEQLFDQPRQGDGSTVVSLRPNE
jgi:hypothetical protein